MSGRAEINGDRRDGVDGCNDLVVISIRQAAEKRACYPKTTQPSSARRLACSQACLASSVSTVPPGRPSISACAAVSHVFTTRLVLASRRYGWAEV